MARARRPAAVSADVDKSFAVEVVPRRAAFLLALKVLIVFFLPVKKIKSLNLNIIIEKVF